MQPSRVAHCRHAATDTTAAPSRMSEKNSWARRYFNVGGSAFCAMGAGRFAPHSSLDAAHASPVPGWSAGRTDCRPNSTRADCACKQTALSEWARPVGPVCQPRATQHGYSAAYLQHPTTKKLSRSVSWCARRLLPSWLTSPRARHLSTAAQLARLFILSSSAISLP